MGDYRNLMKKKKKKELAQIMHIKVYWDWVNLESKAWVCSYFFGLSFVLAWKNWVKFFYLKLGGYLAERI